MGLSFQYNGLVVLVKQAAPVVLVQLASHLSIMGLSFQYNGLVVQVQRKRGPATNGPVENFINLINLKKILPELECRRFSNIGYNISQNKHNEAKCRELKSMFPAQNYYRVVQLYFQEPKKSEKLLTSQIYITTKLLKAGKHLKMVIFSLYLKQNKFSITHRYLYDIFEFLIPLHGKFKAHLGPSTFLGWSLKIQGGHAPLRGHVN